MALQPHIGEGAFRDEPKIDEGPIIDGKPTSISTWSAKQLKDCALLPGLFKTINLAYLTSDEKSFGTSTGDRLKSTEDLIQVLRNDANSFIIILNQTHSDREVLSTASCRRYYGPESDTSRAWACTHTPAPGVEEWELKLVATHPSAQGKGLASYMLGLTEKEVVSRFNAREGSRRKAAAAQSHPKMIMCTPETTFAEFYARRGYGKDYVRPFKNDHIGFDINFMSKMLDPKDGDHME
ncbi:hypothetical protein M409DRAFT_19149 [Zasmidium cellare ATCC 36951]|uniref:N-acetyltransferase domain-containing protein n=1 Tax=Zasmidium cellare ATCC 36951 TaxID=1080233 RepID=A0A6A6CVU5_ZASCE|nr:uncharacterized protein M409DRAFT_19149 [Zasmidium cellare ATCC 36951]KAF2170328.1 hypothetical protein M409DRAFT_19149 [Zasmidium cellare ATCC 36951]